MGTGPFFGGKSCLAKKTSAENMDLSPFAAQGGQSHFRGENVSSFVTSFPPRKSGQSPVNGLLIGLKFQKGKPIMHDPPASSTVDRRLLWIIGVVLAAYFLAAAFQLPQHGAELVVAGGTHGDCPNFRGHRGEAVADENGTVPLDAGNFLRQHPPYGMAAPFVVLLAAIAILPLLPVASHWWESNLHKFYVAGGLAAIALAYYLLLHGAAVEVRWPAPHRARRPPAGPICD